MSQTPAQKRRKYWEDPERHRKRSRDYQRRKREEVLAKKAAQRAQNPGVYVARNRAFRARHPNYNREWISRKKLGARWLHWVRTCAAGRARRAQAEA